MRITGGDVRQAVAVINGDLERAGAEWRVYVGHSAQGYRAYEQKVDAVGCAVERNLSPALPSRSMYGWLLAWYDGLRAGMKLQAANS